MQISGYSAIVTGGASGMGAATARHLSELGAKVSILDTNLAQAEKVAKEINGSAFECNVTQADSVANAIKQAAELQGAGRICINCAGIVHARRMVNKQGLMPLDEFNKVLTVNVLGTFNVMQQAAAAMIDLDAIGEDQERGIIINTASIAAYDGQIGQAAYSASKGSIVSMTLPAAREFAQFGIRVMTIAPGLVATPMFDELPDKARAALEANVPFPKRLAKPSEFAALAQHIIENAMLNGEVIRLDGAIRMQAK